MDWYLKVLRNYIGFGGRARRKEYWMFVLVNFILIMVLGIIDKILGWERAGGEGVLTTIYGLLVLLPSWAVLFRRLHDTDRSAWWLLLLLIPIVGWLVILVFNCQAGTPGKTASGPIQNSTHKTKPGGVSRTGLDFLFVVMGKELGYFAQAPRFGLTHAVAPPRHNDVHFAGVLRADHA